MAKRLYFFLLISSFTTAGFGLEVSGIEIRDRAVAAEIVVGQLELDLRIELEKAVGMNASSLGLTVRPIDASRLRDRVPGNVKALPVVLSFAPPATGPLSFTGTYTLELGTRQLTFREGGRLRLFRARPGGRFEDATKAMGGDGFWIRGEGHGAAEWLLVLDPRPAAAAAERKLTRLETLLTDQGERIHEALYAELWTILRATRAAWERGTPREAIAELAAFADELAAHRDELPDVWRSTGDLANVAGALSSAAASLRFSLVLAGVNAPDDPRAAF